MSKAKKGKGSFLKIIIAIVVITIVGGAIWAYDKYKKVYHPNVSLGANKTAYFYIPTGSTLEDVSKLLYQRNYIINRNSFEWLAEKKNYKNNIYPGKYLLKAGMSNNELIGLLRSGEQEPVKIIFNLVRSSEQLASKIASQIEADSVSIINLLKNASYLKKYGMEPGNVLTMFLPYTYEFYWNTSAEEFLKRMAKEYKNFWTEERKAKAVKIGLTQTEVSILASIVQAEQSIHNDEKPTIAGLYINRLKKGMRLESDPTLLCALGDFSINRVLNIHKKIDSPYNTYKYKGLPPGPVNLPEASSLDAVLNYQKHDYLFMCAKEDFSGYHYFSKNLVQQNIYAHRYRSALNKRKIMR